MLILDIALTVLGLVTVGSYAVMGRGHFQSRSMPLGANLISLAALLSLAIYIWLLWTTDAPLLAQLAGVIIGALGLWLFYRTIAASRDRGLHFAFDPDNPVSLVTTGPYRVVRHPFYTSYLIFWVAMTLGLPVVGIPGETYVYNTGGSHVLGVIVAAAAGMPLASICLAAVEASSRVAVEVSLRCSWSRSGGMRVACAEAAKAAQRHTAEMTARSVLDPVRLFMVCSWFAGAPALRPAARGAGHRSPR